MGEIKDLPQPDAPLSSEQWTRRWLVSATAICSGLLLLQIFRWPLISILTVFLEPLLEIGVACLFLAVAIASLIHGIRHWAELCRWVPFGLCLLTAPIVWFVPFDSLYLKANFRLLEHRRTVFAEALLADKKSVAPEGSGGVEFISLGPADMLLACGGRVFVERHAGPGFVLFPTFEGVLSHFSGYIYSPTDMPPVKDEFDGNGREIYKVAPHWYWYAS